MSLSNISKIYVRTLKSIPERTDWIKKEMSRVGLDDYTLFYNVEKTSSELDEWREKGKIKLGPECFQCGKLKCSCRAKILTRGMVANFISSYKVWEEIVNNNEADETLYMIMEDDVLFQDNVKVALEKVFTSQFVEQVPKEPVLFKLGWGDMLEYRKTHYETTPGTHIFKAGSDKFANPCYVGNKYFFKYLLKNFKRIECACDMWVHRRMAKNIKTFEILPALCKELSHVGNIKSAMHKKYSQPNKYLKLYHNTNNPEYIDKFIRAEKEYFDYWFNYWEEEWGLKLYEDA